MAAPDDVRETIERYNVRICDGYRTGRIDQVVEYFAEDCWQMPPHADPLIGREAVRAFWEQAVQWGDWDMRLHTEDVVASDGIAVERGSYTLSFAAGPSAPLPSAEDRGNYVVLWRREDDGEWRIVWDAPVTTTPPPSAG